MENNNNYDSKGTTLVEEENECINNNIVDKEKPIKPDPDTTRMKMGKISSPKESFSNVFLLVCIMGVSLGILLEIINVVKRNQRFNNENCLERPKYWVYSFHSDVESKTGSLKHVHLVLERLGYEKTSNRTPWDLFWSHDFPFNAFQKSLQKLQPHQRVNHIPGSGYITTKVILATSNSKYIPKAFRLPKSKDEFLKYAAENKNSLFLEKDNQHRGVSLKNVSEIDVSSGESFVQEYLQKPFLVDGHKFDIGVYVVITSVDPLRAYWYKGDVLFRYCPAKYYPFDPKNLDKYVIADDYLPTWEVPSLAQSHSALGYSMKDTFDNYVRSKGKDPSSMWEEIQKAIAETLVMNEHYMVAGTKRYPSADNFFEMMRFDLIVDEDLKVYLLEANMSPNLSSAHFSANALLYEQVLYNLFSLTGISHRPYVAHRSDKVAARDMVSSQKNIGVFGEQCRTICNDDCAALELCKLCKPCLDKKVKHTLLKAHTEFIHRGEFGRLVPPPMSPMKDMKELAKLVRKNMTMMNTLQHMWFQGKCNQDIAWCT